MKSATTKLVLGFLIYGFIFFALPTSVAAYGESTTPGTAPVCNNRAPLMPWPFWAKAAGNNTVDLTWGKLDDATSWTAAYGTKPHTYIYGVHNFGNSESRSIRISNLPAGRYYFALRANNGCMPGPFSNELMVTIQSGVTKVTPTPAPVTGVKQAPQTTIQPKVTPKITPKVSPTILQSPVMQKATPAPKQASLWQRLINFFMSWRK